MKTQQRILKFGPISFEVRTLPDGRLWFDYMLGARRVVVKKTTLAKLHSAAEIIAQELLEGEATQQLFDPALRRMCALALNTLHPTGLHIDAVARDVAAAYSTTGGIPITELAAFYMARNPSKAKPPETATLVQSLVKTLSEAGREDIYVRGLKRDLMPFAERHPDITLLNVDHIRDWLHELQARKDRPIGERRRDNIRDAIVRLFSYARDRRLLPEDRRTAAERILRIKPGHDVSTYTPDELRALLAHVPRRWIPRFVIAAFAGLRTSEIFRLNWPDFKWDRGVIHVRRQVAKKVRLARVVPILPVLAAWLKPWRKATGPIYPHENWKQIEDADMAMLTTLSEVSGIKWRKNALRHSFGSYRLAIVKSIEQVAGEMGNSSGEVRRSYNDPKDEKEALAYFASKPSIIKMAA